ncbi:MAG: LacI family DNA-binding transcriptional regulator [Vallitaleaceae bacterium]|nr:LacI family DNA-binding transcriptional regulator [Vallitaleaceae bacterium]
MEKKPTIKTIAKLAGISYVAVSKALRDHADISPATKEKVRKIADEIGYIPNLTARNLSQRTSNNIGMIVPDLGNDTIYSEVFNEISRHAAHQGINLLLGSSCRDLDLEKKFCENMCRNNIGALIISPVSSDTTHIKKTCPKHMPIIFLGGKTGTEETYCITLNYRLSGEKAVDYLYRLGHRNILLLLYAPFNRTIAQKQEGYLSKIHELGLVPNIMTEGSSDNTYDAGRRAVNKLLRDSKLPDAIFCASDLMALGVLDELQKSGILVPEEVSLIGHDDMFFTKVSSIGLSTFRIPKQEIGKKIIEMVKVILQSTQENRETPPALCQITLECALIERNTTASKKRSEPTK